jgi:hypothetical protein
VDVLRGRHLNREREPVTLITEISGAHRLSIQNGATGFGITNCEIKNGLLVGQAARGPRE